MTSTMEDINSQSSQVTSRESAAEVVESDVVEENQDYVSAYNFFP
jgi:hypothetical protein